MRCFWTEVKNNGFLRLRDASQRVNLSNWAVLENTGDSAVAGAGKKIEDIKMDAGWRSQPVSYTHLTLPTIYSV